MYDLMKSEFARYKSWLLIIMLLHFAGWWFTHINQISLLSGNSPMVIVIWAAAVIGGFLFGLLQMGLYKKASKWAWLIHRPLAPAEIFTSLVGAGALLLFFALMVPIFTVTIILDSTTGAVIDARHYLFAPYIMGLAFGAYLLGIFTQLYPNKGAVLVAALLGFVIVRNSATTALTTFLPLAVVLVWLFYLNLKAFKPDLGTHFTAKRDIVLTALPTHLSISFLLIFVAIPFYHLPLFILGTHPDPDPPKGSYAYFRWHLPESERAVFLLKDIAGARGDALRQQVRLGDVDYIYPGRFSPKRNQMFYQDRDYQISDPETGDRWIFSHDLMLFKGIRAHTGDAAGWLGRNGFADHLSDMDDGDKFSSIPRISHDQYVITPEQLLFANFTDRVLETRHSLEGEEVYSSLLNIREDYVAILTNRALYMFDEADFLQGHDDIAPEHVVPNPGAIDRIGEIQTVGLVNGYLLTYISDPFSDPDRIIKSTLVARLDGEIEPVETSVFPELKHPAVIRHNEFVNSPFIDVVKEMVWGYITPGETGRRTNTAALNLDMPLSVFWTVGFIAVFSAAFAGFLCRKWALDKPRTIMWVLLSAVVGLPGVISFFILNDWHWPVFRRRRA